MCFDHILEDLNFLLKIFKKRCSQWSIKKLKYAKRKEIQRIVEEGCSIRKVKDLTGVPESTISQYKRVFGVFKPLIKIKKNKISQLLERVVIRKFIQEK